jgi:hypothetical protein
MGALFAVHPRRNFTVRIFAMSTWVKCTSPQGDVSYINLARAVRLVRDKENSKTSVLFETAERLLVKETPQELIEELH